MEYKEFLKTKEYTYQNTGFDIDISELDENLFDFQKQIVKWALKKGKCALFLDTGLGKTICQLEFANQVCKHENGKALILAPLAVSKQTKQEGEKFGIEVNICRTQADVKDGINITNYEMLQHFNPNEFCCIVLDESSILKSFSGKMSAEIIEAFRFTKYKLACTATPSPNDYQELGTHSDFLNIMSRTEMLATFFINDTKESQWRMKRHAESKFWEWLATWAMVVKNPADIGYPDERYNLTKLNIEHIIVDSKADKGALLPSVAQTLQERRQARKDSMQDRISVVGGLLKDMDSCLIWVDYNDESTSIAKQFEITEVTGSDSDEHKENAMLGFANGDIKYLVSKPSICGFGMNFQKCHNMIFCGISDSFERFYQAIRRCYRFGQTEEVNVYVIISQKEISVLNNIKRKEEQHQRMSQNMIDRTSSILKNEIHSTMKITEDYIADKLVVIPSWVKTESEEY
jgi:superfamily II DNA or RNA helicase